MKEVFRSSDSGRVAVHRAVLEAAGFECFVRNESTQQALVAGIATAFFPLPGFWPTLCLVDDDDYAEAMHIMNGANTAEPATNEWACSDCKQPVPGHFELCWYCHTEKPSLQKQARPPGDVETPL